MRVLHVNKFLYRRGGAEGYMEDVATLQRAGGDDVAFFAMDHPENDSSPFEAHFPPYMELDPPPPGAASKVRAVGRMLHSTSSARGIAAVIDEFRPDVAHLHNIYHHLSPSILRPLKAAGVAVVMTLHDYKLACPTYQFLAGGEVCEACLGGRFQNAVRKRCKGGSLTASAVAAFELFAHTTTGAYGRVDRFICPSRFMRDKMTAAGVFPDRMRWVPHFVDGATLDVKERPGGDLVFAGRLSHEKGVDVLIDAMARMRDGTRCLVAGDGPARAELEARAESVAPGRVRFLGRLGKAELHDLVRRSTALVMPSRWHENQPMIVLEAFGCGVPVIGTTLGGTPELIEPGCDGLLVAPADADALAAAAQQLLDDPEGAFEMGRRARDKVENDFSPERHLQRVRAVYGEVHQEALAGS